MANLVLPDGTRRRVQPAQGPSFTLRELQTFVGGYIEVVRLPRGRMMVINEEGKNNNLPVNIAATALAAPVLFPGDWIVGPAVVLSAQELGE